MRFVGGASVLLLLGVSAGCSNQPRGSDTGSAPNRASTVVQAARAQFRFRDGAAALPAATRSIAKGGDGLTADPEGALAGVRYPARADAPVIVTDAKSGVEARVAPIGAAPVDAELADGLVVYRDALGAGVPLLHRATSAGTEDYVLFDHAPSVARVSFSVTLGEKVAGLRLVGNVLELLDDKSSPRVRVASPWIVGRDGEVADAKLAVEGCSYDSDPAPPWDRAPHDPGARVCKVHVSWERDAIKYPALLDPAWQSAGTIGTNRNNATAVACTGTTTSGRVLVAGGQNASGGAVLASAEVFNASTNTWAATASMTTARYSAVAVADKGGNDIYVTGGRNSGGGAIGANERWNCGTGAWTGAGTFTARWGHALAVSTNGEIFAVGGRSGSSTMVAEIARMGSGTWQSWFGPARAEHTAYAANATSFPDGSSGHSYCVVWMGGRNNTGTVLNTTGGWCDGVDGETGLRTGAPLPGPRANHQMVKFGSQYLLVGGTNGTSDLATVDVFTPTAYQIFGSGGIAAGTTMPVARNGHIAVAINASDVLVAGGAGTAATTSHLLQGGSWIPAGPLLGSHANGIAAAPLPSGGALVVGGPSAPERWAQRGNGTACTNAGECSSGFCVDGVCCNTACNGTCQSCTAALKGAGSDGTCGNTRNGGPSDGACGTTSASSCGDDGTCNGAGACRKWPAGTECQAQSCASSTLQNNRRTCNGSGACQALTTTTCNAAYVCTSLGTSDGCATSCTGTDDSKCAPGHYCNGSTCVPALAKATACTRDRQCGSGFCTDGVCCGTRCGGPCEACTATFKGSGADGDCGNVAIDTDPRNRCDRDPGYPASCKADGFCDGAGACRSFAVTGTECAAPTCTSGKSTTSVCDGGGVCNLSEKSCAPSSCNPAGTACLGDCGSDTECDSSGYCDATTKKCVAKKPNGEAAMGARECQSGILADGVCCNDACDGLCEACDGMSTKGTCTAVAGKARHGDCPAGSGEDPCTAASCDGKDRKACAARAGSDTVCKAASCTGGIETIETRCDGTGTCPTPATKNCQPYACDAAACKVKCTTNGDCASGFFCDPSSGICGAGASCIDDKTLQRSDGTTETCVAFKCSGQACLKACSNTAECLPGFVCNSANQQCEPAPAETGNDGGCSMGNSTTSAAWSIALLAGLAALARRRSQRAGG